MSHIEKLVGADGWTSTFTHVTPPQPVHEAERARLAGKKWIQTASGGRFFPLDPKAADVCIEDIAHALSMKCRFTGHTSRFYSVAEHCVRVSQLVPREFALHGLLHDAAEAYLPDLAAPVKRSFWVDGGEGMNPGRFSWAEGRVLDAIYEALGITTMRAAAESEQVKKADLVMLATEVEYLMGFSGKAGDPALGDWHFTEKPHDFSDRLGWDPATAELQFMQRFQDLTGGAL